MTTTEVVPADDEPDDEADLYRDRHRPWRPDWDKIEVMFQVMHAGVSIDTAARAAGLAPTTVHEWIGKGRAMRDGTPHPKVRRFSDRRMIDFANRIEQVRAETQALLLGRIVRASEQDWKAGAWFLERAYPSEWGRRISTEVSGPGGTPITLRAEPEQPVDADSVAEMRAIMQRAGMLPADAEVIELPQQAG